MVVSAMLYNANYSFEFLIKLTEKTEGLCVAQLLIFSFILLTGERCVCARLCHLLNDQY